MEIAYDVIYWFTTTVIVVSLLFALRHYKRAGKIRIFALAMFAVTALYWEYAIRIQIWTYDHSLVISDIMYDVCLMTASLCTVYSIVRKRKFLCHREDCKNREK